MFSLILGTLRLRQVYTIYTKYLNCQAHNVFVQKWYDMSICTKRIHSHADAKVLAVQCIYVLYSMYLCIHKDSSCYVILWLRCLTF